MGPLKAALTERGSLRGAIVHADHGTQYTSRGLARLCGQLAVIQSFGGVGSSADNALAEGFNATLRRETLAGAPAFADQAPCRREIFRWTVRYTTRRRHNQLRHQGPSTDEKHVRGYLPGSRLIERPVSRSGVKGPKSGANAATATRQAEL